MQSVKNYENMLANAENIITNPNSTPEELREIIAIRDAAFIELIRNDVDFSLTNDFVVVVLNGNSYTLSKDALLGYVGETEYQQILSKRIPPQSAYQMHSNNDMFIGNNTNQIPQTQSQSMPSVPTRLNESNLVAKKRTGNILNNAREIAFIGLERGVGTTHTAIMLAATLAKDYDVAYIELNKNGHIAAMAEWLQGKKQDEQISVNKIDFYFNINYNYFAVNYKDSYDYIILDYGVYDEKETDVASLLRTDIRFIVASGIDWNLPKLSNIYKENQFARSNSSVYVIPFLEGKALAPVEKVITANDIVTAPLTPNPFEPNAEIRGKFMKYFIDANSKGSKKRFSLFRPR